MAVGKKIEIGSLVDPEYISTRSAISAVRSTKNKPYGINLTFEAHISQTPNMALFQTRK